MKRLLLVLAALLFAGAWLGEAIIEDSGYVLIAYQNISIETSLWVLLAIALVAFAVLHWVINLVFNFKSPAQKLKQWRHARHERKAGERAIEGLKARANGDWWRSRRLLAQAGNLSSAPLIYYIEAARMAARDGNEKETHRLLQLAGKTTPGAEFLIKQVGAELDLDLGHTERAQAAVDQLLKQQPNNLVTKQLNCRALEQQGNWQAIAKLIPELRKANVLSEEHARQLRRKYAAARLQNPDLKLDELIETWNGISYDAQQETEVKRVYIDRLIELEGDDQAAKVLKEWLGKSWDEQLLDQYGRLATTDTKAQLQQAKRWAKKHSQSAALELCLARLSRKEELWSEAIQHYRRSLELSFDQSCLNELTELLLQSGESDEARTLLANQNSQLPSPASKSEEATGATKAS